jgi:hypothetical protein
MFEDRGLFGFAKRALWLQDLVVTALARAHPLFDHTFAKVMALKKAFYSVELDCLEGDYLEFGVYQGTSFVAALQSWRSVRGDRSPRRRFFGFDSFEGFKYSEAKDRHPVFVEGEFKVDYERVRRRISRRFARHAEWRLVRGYLEDSIAGRSPTDFGIEKAAVILIDLDLGKPTKVALDFVRPALQEGTVVLFDDYMAYRGRPDLGEQGALADFERENPGFAFRRFFDYGLAGRVFIVVETP